MYELVVIGACTSPETFKVRCIFLKHFMCENPINFTPNQASLKLEARLIPIEGMLAYLLNPSSNKYKESTTTTISKAIKVLHCERKVNYHIENPTVHPSSIRFEFNLTCKAEYEWEQV